VQWWCFAREGAWTWAWQPIPGVWAFVLSLGLVYHLRSRHWHQEAPGPGGLSLGWRKASFYGGVLLLWVSLDWPIGPLGAGYLASVHMLQFVLVGVVAPALLLVGIPEAGYRSLPGRRFYPFLRQLTHPVSAFVVFNVIMTISHWPGLVDRLMPTQLGSFVMDLSWMFAGLVLWFPVIAPVPHGKSLHPLYKIGYLALNAFLIRPPFAMMIFSAHPIYEIYELAPPVGGVDPLADQQLGGAIMKIGTAWAMGAGVVAAFFDWRRAEEGGRVGGA
jgi:putative membrane protein